MKKETVEEYIQHYIDFYKDYHSDDTQLIKLINTTLHCILNRYKKNRKKLCETIRIELHNHCYIDVGSLGWAINQEKIEEIFDKIEKGE